MEEIMKAHITRVQDNRTLNFLVILTAAVVLSLQTGCAYLTTQQHFHLSTPTPLSDDQTLIIGFLGGRQLWDDDSRGVRQLAVKLDEMSLANAEIETFQNRRRDLAMEFIHKALDRNGDDILDPQERASARLILYGQSLGGSAVVKLSEALEKIDIPVLLTVQVDSVGFSDHLIPSNVSKAANIYQSNDWIFSGEDEIMAIDPEATSIVANIEFDYSDKEVDMTAQPWQRRLFSTPHSMMDADPEVWALVEELILDELGIHKENFLVEDEHLKVEHPFKG
ncbi:MAG: hypothetical protein PVG97_08920 [Syntrophobacterales bacterium]